MENTKKNLGDLFRTKREEMSLSLKEVENAISIRKSYLKAIEENDIEKYISAVYASGFIKQYANFLGFDGNKIVAEDVKTANMNKKAKEDFSFGIGTLEMRQLPQTNVKWMPNLLWTGLGIAILVFAYLFAKMLGVF